MAQKSIIPAETLPSPDEINPQNGSDYARRGWLYFSQQKLQQAQLDLEKAVELDNDLDSLYALGLVYRSQGLNEKALECFDQVLARLSEIPDQQRATMVRRLTLGQVNRIKMGDWNLEKELWKRIR